MLQYYFNWRVLSAGAGISWWNFYFRLYPSATNATELIDFFGHLMRHLPGKLRVVWDRLPQHRARLVTEVSGRGGAHWRSRACRPSLLIGGRGA